jgi:rubrerythrin
MDKDYLDILKNTDLRPGKVKIKDFTPPSGEQIIMENKKVLTELFVQAGEIEALPEGQERDTQILRLGMIAELDAVNLYNKLAALASSPEVAKLMLDVSREEKVHAGEFEVLMERLDPDYEKAEEEGEEEVEDLLNLPGESEEEL